MRRADIARVRQDAAALADALRLYLILPTESNADTAHWRAGMLYHRAQATIGRRRLWRALTGRKP